MFWSRISRIAMRPTSYSSALLISAFAGPPRSGRLLPIDAVLGVKLALAAESAAPAHMAVTVNRQPSRAAQVRGISSRDINTLYFTSTASQAPRFRARPNARALQGLGGEVREPRALAAYQRDMPRVWPALETVHDVGQPAGGLGEVRGIDLGDIAQAHQLAARSGARYQRLHLLRGQILRLVEDDETIQERTAAHEIE